MDEGERRAADKIIDAWQAARQRAAASLAPDLLAFVAEIADFSGNTTIQVRARVLLAHIDLAAKKAVGR